MPTLENKFTVVLDTKPEGFTTADIVACVNGRYFQCVSDFILPNWKPESNSREFCYPRIIPDRLRAVLYGVTESVHALTGNGTCWYYVAL